MEYIERTTVEGERWDTIANEAFGDPTKIDLLYAANPHIPAYDVLPGGIVMYVPIIPKEQTVPNNELLPPWKR